MSLEKWQDLLRFLDPGRLPAAVVVVLVGWFLARLSTRLLDQLAERTTERRFTYKRAAVLLRFLLQFLALAAAIFLVVDERAIVPLSALLVLALGFALKEVLASITGGLFLVIDAPFRVGDRIAYAGYYGEVKKIGLRAIQLVTLDDNLVTIPNGKLLTEPVASANAGAPDCMVVVPFYLAPDEDFDKARRLIAEAAFTSHYVYLEKPVKTLVSEEFLGERFVTVIRVKAYVFDVRYEKDFASDVTERVKRAFRRANIAAPERRIR